VKRSAIGFGLRLILIRYPGRLASASSGGVAELTTAATLVSLRKTKKLVDLGRHPARGRQASTAEPRTRSEAEVIEQ